MLDRLNSAAIPVVLCDNKAGLLTPPLTTMRISCEEIADAAFERLVTRISNPDLPPTEVLLPAELVVRESTLVKEVKG